MHARAEESGKFTIGKLKSFLLLHDLRLEVIFARVVDNGGINEHHCLNFVSSIFNFFAFQIRLFITKVN